MQDSEARQQLESETRGRERHERAQYDDPRYEALVDQLDAIMTAQTIAGFSGDVLNSINRYECQSCVGHAGQHSQLQLEGPSLEGSNGAAAPPEI